MAKRGKTAKKKPAANKGHTKAARKGKPARKSPARKKTPHARVKEPTPAPPAETPQQTEVPDAPILPT